jgi:hypothetical protein
MSDHNRGLREHLLKLLRGGSAHISLDNFVGEFPVAACGQKIDGLPFTPWQVLEHMRIAQWDILEFSRDPKHTSPDFPSGYWPQPDELGNRELWHQTIEKFRGDLKQIEDLTADPSTDLLATIPHGDGQTILREALVTADHNAYHLGELVVMSRILKHYLRRRAQS